MKIHTIHLDMDQVLVNLFEACCNAMGQDYQEMSKRDDVKNNYEYSDIFGYTWEQFWLDKVNNLNFWTNAPKMPWADDLVALCKEYESDNVEVGVLSAPIFSPHCFAGKMLWINNHYPELLPNITITKNKHKVVNPQDLLIDDSENILKKFAQHKLNKQVFFFPSLTNSFYNDVPDPAFNDDVEQKKEVLFTKLRSHIEDKIGGIL